MPKVSVIIPNYNHSLFLIERIESVINQTFQDFEVILLDDCSPDNSREIIENYRNHPKVTQIVYNEKNSGSTFRQWQKGIKLAKGEWIWIAESDDIAEINFLEELLSKSNNENGIVYSRSKLINSLNEPINYFNYSSMPDPNISPQFSENFSLDGKEFIQRHMQTINSIPNASAVIFRKQMVDYELFQVLSTIKLNGDWLFWISILKKSNISYVNQLLNSFRFHDKTVRDGTKLTSTSLIELTILIKYLEKEIGSSKESIDALIFHYFKKDNKWKTISLKDHLFINRFIFKRKATLLLKTYLHFFLQKL